MCTTTLYYVSTSAANQKLICKITPIEVSYLNSIYGKHILVKVRYVALRMCRQINWGTWRTFWGKDGKGRHTAEVCHGDEVVHQSSSLALLYADVGPEPHCHCLHHSMRRYKMHQFPSRGPRLGIDSRKTHGNVQQAETTNSPACSTIKEGSSKKN